MLDRHADRGQPGAKSEQREDVRDQDPDRNLPAGEHEGPPLAVVTLRIEGRKHLDYLTD